MGELIVLNKDADTVDYIDADSFEEIERFETGYHPDGITYLQD